jgi:DNA repair exonuclease SbcCD ATPase subunit
VSADLLDRLRRGQHTIQRQVGEAKAVAERAVNTKAEIAHLRAAISRHERAATVLTSFGEQRQADAQRHIETLVTQGLRTIFDDPDLTFHVVPTVRSRRPEVDFIVRSRLGDTTVDTDVLDGRGGGLAATVGFLLRLVILLLSPDRQDTVLFLDETFAFLSEDHHPAMAQFLRELTDKTGVQIIMVTHTPALAEHADRVYHFEQRQGATVVRAM